MAALKYYKKLASDILNSPSYSAINVADPTIIRRWLCSTSAGADAMRHLMKANKSHASETKQYQSLLKKFITIRSKIVLKLKRGKGVRNPIQITRQNRNIHQHNEQTVKRDDSQTTPENRICTYVIANFAPQDIDKLMEEAFKFVELQIESAFKKLDALKVRTELSGKYVIIRDNKAAQTGIEYFTTKSFAVNNIAEVHEWFNTTVKEEIGFKIEQFQQGNSGWSLRSILNLTIFVDKAEKPKVSGVFSIMNT